MHIVNISAVLSLPNLQRFRCCTKCQLALITCSQPACPCQPQGEQFGPRARRAGPCSQPSLCFVVLCSSEPFSEPQLTYLHQKNKPPVSLESSRHTVQQQGEGRMRTLLAAALRATAWAWGMLKNGLRPPPGLGLDANTLFAEDVQI